MLFIQMKMMGRINDAGLKTPVKEEANYSASNKSYAPLDCEGNPDLPHMHMPYFQGHST